MKSRFFILLYLCLFVLTAYLSYNIYPAKDSVFGGKSILSLNDKVFLRYKKIFDIDKISGYIWGIKDSIKKQKKDKTSQKKNKKNFKLKIIKKGFSICVQNDCFRLLGIFYKQHKPYASFYNKNYKRGLNDFTIGEAIGYTLYVKSINRNAIMLKDKNSNRYWNIKLFDVNQTKYKPKDINETDY